MKVNVEIELEYATDIDASINSSEFQKLIALLQLLRNFEVPESGDTQTFRIHFKNDIKI